MNKAQLIQKLRDSDGRLTKREAERAVNIFFDAIANALASGEGAQIRNFCTFFVKQYKSYGGRNPKTGHPVKIPPKKLSVFRPGQELRKRVARLKGRDGF